MSETTYAYRFPMCGGGSVPHPYHYDCAIKRISLLEKVCELVAFYGTHHAEIKVAMRKAGYLGEGQ